MKNKLNQHKQNTDLYANKNNKINLNLTL